MPKIKLIDSCVYPKNYTFKGIKDLSDVVKSEKIYKALCMSVPETDMQKFFTNVKKTTNLIPIASLKKKIKFKFYFYYLKKIGYKFLKVHPRYLNLKLRENILFYKNIFKHNQNYKFNLMFCTLQSWENKFNYFNLLEFLSEMSCKYKDQKMILMHSGGPKVLEYYEIFRFAENVYLDLSYSMMHFKETSLFNDYKFLMKNFDRRILLGSDYPCFSYKDFKKTILKYSKGIKNSKKHNYFFNNLNNLIKD